MRYFLWIFLGMLFVGCIVCTFLLGGPPGSVYDLRDVLLAAVLICALLSVVILSLLTIGIGSKGKKRSYRLTVLFGIPAFLISLAFGIVAVFANYPTYTYEHVAVGVRFWLSGIILILLSLFYFSETIISLILIKKHNAKLA